MSSIGRATALGSISNCAAFRKKYYSAYATRTFLIIFTFVSSSSGSVADMTKEIGLRQYV